MITLGMIVGPIVILSSTFLISDIQPQRIAKKAA